jgi:hypothetical protein
MGAWIYTHTDHHKGAPNQRRVFVQRVWLILAPFSVTPLALYIV